ncbi:hypothetical protein ID866_745 [Astraeus odoratus]|nr:hypothetical protein ID866_745 [Astraeus odoratus]
MLGHVIDYSKSSRSVCSGPPPCTGTPISSGSLRYGQTIPSQYGETVVWRHWGCVTPEILRDLAVADFDTIRGFSALRSQDQVKVRCAIASGRIDPADVPASAKIVAPAVIRPSASTAPPSICSQSTLPSGGRQQKRKQPSEHSGTLKSLDQAAVASAGVHRLLDDEDEEIVLIDPEPVDELYCKYETKVVGIQYYKGMCLVGAGEKVRVVRDPRNAYDVNAIKVVNIAGMQVGHLPREVAAKIAPLVDRKLVSLDGTMLEGNIRGFKYSLGLELWIYGASEKRDILEPQLIWTTPGRRFPPRGSGRIPGMPTSYVGGPSSSGTPTYGSAAISDITPATHSYSQTFPSRGRSNTSRAQTQAEEEAIKKQQEALRSAAELKQMLNSLEKIDDEGRRASLLDTLCPVDDILNLPVHPNPPGVASGELLSQALQWCIDHEYPALPTKESDKPVQFWQYRKEGNKSYYFNRTSSYFLVQNFILFPAVITRTPQDISTPPVLGRGALVADSMGLGKTLTMLALILSTKNDVPTDYSYSTLIVVPLSVVSNWEKQIKEHCARDTLTACVYYGTSRNKTADELAKYDIVITTYQTVVGEASPDSLADGYTTERPKKKKKSETGLFDVKWKVVTVDAFCRIILDEGHNVRNPKTKMARSVCKLSAQRRWVLSGTPIVNSPRDLGSILTFLQICRPMDNEDFFKRLLLRPLKDGDPAGAELLHVDITLIPVALHEEARALYDAVEAASYQRVENMMNRTGGMNTIVTSNVLSMLTRLRQIALHSGLVPSNYLEQLRASDEIESSQRNSIQITVELKGRLQSQLAKLIEDNEECPICLSVLIDPRITLCAHAFCIACISEVIARNPKCPMDRHPISMGDLIEAPPPFEFTQPPAVSTSDKENHSREQSSAKIDQLIHLLKLLPGDEKSLVFSQFTSFLDKIGETLDEHGIPYVRFDGQLSARKRQEVLECFTVPLETEASATDASMQSTRNSRQTCSRASATNGTGYDSYADKDGDEDSIDSGETEVDDNFEGNISSRSRGKSKSKAKGKEPMTLKSAFNRSTLTGVNPKVMLISLKAGWIHGGRKVSRVKLLTDATGTLARGT